MGEMPILKDLQRHVEEEGATTEIGQDLSAAIEVIQDLSGQVKRLNRIATDRRYMMDAYKAFLGPVASDLVKKWDDAGIARQHTSWGPEAFNISGEERAQALLDAFSATSSPLNFGDRS